MSKLLDVTDTNGKNVTIRELQEYLRVIAFDDESIPIIRIDGVFGSETEAAVKAFQKKFDLNPTGIVKNDTWNKIYEVYLKAIKSTILPRGIQSFPNDKYIIKIGDDIDSVTFIQVMLNELSKIFTNLKYHKITGIYDMETSNNIKEIQKNSDKKITGNVNLGTWDILTALYNSMTKEDNLNLEK